MAFIVLLAALQALLLLWFTMIVRLAIRVVRGSPAEDDRSDDEDEDEDEPEEKEATDLEDIASLSVANGNMPAANGFSAAHHETTWKYNGDQEGDAKRRFRFQRNAVSG